MFSAVESSDPPAGPWEAADGCRVVGSAAAAVLRRRAGAVGGDVVAGLGGRADAPRSETQSVVGSAGAPGVRPGSGAAEAAVPPAGLPAACCPRAAGSPRAAG